MRGIIDIAKKAKAESVASQKAGLEMVRECKVTGQNVLKSLADIEKREKNLISIVERVEKRSRDLEEREMEFERRKSEVAVKGEILGPLLKEFTKEVELREEKLDEQLKVVNKHIESLEADLNEFHRLKSQQREKLTEIEGKEREIDLIRLSLEKTLREVEQRERECKSDLNKAQVLKQLLFEKEKEIEEKTKGINVAQESVQNRLREVERREKECNLEQNKAQVLKHLLCEKEKEIEGKERDICSTRGSLQKRLREVEQREKESLALQKELQGLKHRQCEKLKKIEEKKRENDSIEGTLEKRLREVDQREEEVGLLQNEVQSMKLLKSEKLKEIEEKEKEIDLKRESLEKRLREVEHREKDCETIQNKAQALKQLLCDKQKEIEEKKREISLAKESLENRLREVEQRERESVLYQKKAQALEQLLCEKQKEIEEKEKGIQVTQRSLEDRLRGVEQREKESNSFQRTANKATLTLDKRTKEIKEEEMRINLLQESLEKRLRELEQKEKDSGSLQTELQGREQLLCEKLKEIEEKEMDIDSISGCLEKRARDVEQREKELDLSQDRKWKELVSKEELLNKKREEFIEFVNLAERKFREEEKMGCSLITRLESMIERVKATTGQRFNKIESLEAAAHNALIANVNGVESILEKLLHETKRREEEFHLHQVERERELELEEKKLRLIMEEFIQEVKYREEKFVEQEKKLCGLLSRLEMAQRNIVDMNKVVKERFKKLCSKEGEFHYDNGCAEKKMNELLEPKTEEIRELKEVTENGMVSQRKGLELKKQNLEMYNFPQRYQAFTRHCALNELQQPAIYHLNGEPSGYDLREHELKKQKLTHAFDQSVGLDQAAAVKSLEMVINTGKELELMAQDVFKALLLSPDPAKLVLDAIENFRTPFMAGDMELKMQVRALILDQLTNMSPKIGDSVKKAALKLANEWKSTMRIVEENPLQVLEFLHLLAAYNLQSHFAKDELLSYLKAVAKHKQTPELCRILGLTDEMHVLVRNLINQKQYLLASTYIYECDLGKVFPQASVLDYHMRHVTMEGNSRRENRHLSSEVQVKAIFNEIAELRIAIEHIVKHGLESEYSPNIVLERIKQLEHEMADIKNGIVSSASTNRHRQERGERSSQLLDGAHVVNAQLHEQDLGDGPTFGCGSQGHQNGTRKRSYNVVEIKHYHLTQVDTGPVRFPRGSRRKRKAYPRDPRNSLYWHDRLGRPLY